MKKLLKFLLYFLFFIFTIYLFFPKERAFYYVENNILKNIQIVISHEKFKNTTLGVSLKDFDIFYNGINIAKVEKLDFKSFIIYSSIHIDNFLINKDFKDFIPLKLNSISIRENIFNPNILNIKTTIKNSEIRSQYNIKNKILYLKIPTNFDKKFTKTLKKIQGEYNYEYKF